ncbi:MAG: FUSC family protein [Atopobiaceae bacterium]|nr:FUSC family protein [Atopobiaceae bacterium]MDD3486006.1 FUSC family protein [Atopobiaceae bacterium]
MQHFCQPWQTTTPPRGAISLEDDRSIVGGLLPTLVLTASMMVSLTAGLLIGNRPLVVAFVFPVVYYVFYFITNANELPFPMYFFIAMCLVIGCNAGLPEGILGTVAGVEAGITLLVCAANVVPSCLKGLPLWPQDGLRHEVITKYRLLLQRDERMPLRILVHCLLLFVAGIIAYRLRDFRGQWVLLATGAVLIGDDLDTLTIRGLNFAIGVTIGCSIAWLFEHFAVSLGIRVWVYVPAMLVALTFMPKVGEKPWCYIIGSSMVALMAMTGNSLGQPYLTQDIIAERFLCGLLGVAFSLVSCRVVSIFAKEVYSEPEDGSHRIA